MYWLQDYRFFFYTILIILAEVWLVYYIYKRTSRIFFLAVSPLRWLSILIVCTKYQESFLGLLTLFMLLAAFYWILNNILINRLVLKRPILYVGKNGAVGKLMHRLFPTNTGTFTMMIKLTMFAGLLFVYSKF